MSELTQPAFSALSTVLTVALAVWVVWLLKDKIRDIVKTAGVREFELTKTGVKAKFDPEIFAEEAYRKQGMGKPSPEDVKEVGAIAESFAPLIAGRRVLWVDNHPANNLLESSALVKWGVDVQMRRTTEEALTELRDDKIAIDLVISDWYRGGREEGIRLAEQMWQSVPPVRVPIIYYFSADTPENFQKIKRKAEELSAIGATSSPRELLKWTFAELVRATVLNAKA